MRERACTYQVSDQGIPPARQRAFEQALNKEARGYAAPAPALVGEFIA